MTLPIRETTLACAFNERNAGRFRPSGASRRNPSPNPNTKKNLNPLPEFATLWVPLSARP